MEWLKELREFLWAVVTNWAGYATGGIAVAVIGLWSTLHQSPISRKIGIAVALIFLFFALFNAWRQQKHAAKGIQRKLDALSNPDFDIVAFPAFAYYDGNNTFVFLPLQIANNGADSAVLGYNVHYRSKTLDQDVKLFNIQTDQLEIPTDSGEVFALRRNDALNMRTGVIAHGDVRVGRLPIVVPGNHMDELETGAEIDITAWDYLKRPHRKSITSGAGGNKLQYVPGEPIPLPKK